MNSHVCFFKEITEKNNSSLSTFLFTMKFISFIIFFEIVFAISASDAEVIEKEKKILALGGNGFIGSAVLHNLMSKGDYKQVIR